MQLIEQLKKAPDVVWSVDQCNACCLVPREVGSADQRPSRDA